MSIVVVYPRMACQLIGAREAFFAPEEGARERLFAGVRADVAGLWWRLGLMGSDLEDMGRTWCSSLLNALPHSG